MGRRVSGLICWKRKAPAPSRQGIYTDREERTGVWVRAAVSCSRACLAGWAAPSAGVAVGASGVGAG